MVYNMKILLIFVFWLPLCSLVRGNDNDESSNQISISTNLRNHFDSEGFTNWRISDKFTPRLSIHYSRWLNKSWRFYGQVNDFNDNYFYNDERGSMFYRYYFLPQIGFEKVVASGGSNSFSIGSGLSYRHGVEKRYSSKVFSSFYSNSLRDVGAHLQCKYQLDVRQHWALMASTDFTYYFYRKNEASYGPTWEDGATQYLLKCHVGVGYKF